MKNNINVKLVAILVSAVIFMQTNSVLAATIGSTGSVINSDYVAIINTSTTSEQSTGTINFEDTNITKTSKKNEQNNITVPNTNSDDGHTHSDSDEKTMSNVTSVLNSVKNAPIKTYNIGDKKHIYNKDYTVIGIGQHSYIWMEDRKKAEYDNFGVTEKAAKEMMNVYDGKPYEILNEIAGGNIHYADNSGKMSILLEDTGGSSGFFAGEDDITALHINAPSGADYRYGNFKKLDGLLVHEGQHALLHWIIFNGEKYKTNDIRWINEGISVAAMEYAWGGSTASGWLSRINGDQDIRAGASLFYTSSRGKTSLDYGMPYLFVRYLINQHSKHYDPMAFFKKLYFTNAKNKTAEQWLNDVIKSLNIPDVTNIEEALTGFFGAAFAQEPTGKFGFYNDLTIMNTIKDYPVYYGVSGKPVNLQPTGAIIVKTKNGKFTVPNASGSNIKFVGINAPTDTLKPNTGAGTQSSPYIIDTVDELFSISYYTNAHFKLGADIDLKGRVWIPGNDFAGVLDGNGHTINNLNDALFNTMVHGTIKNLNVHLDINREYSDGMGGLVKYHGGTITDVNVTGTINTKLFGSSKFKAPYLGAVVGIANTGSIIKNTSSNVTMNVSLPASVAYVGGIVGELRSGMENTYSQGAITITQPFNESHEMNVGGIAGQVYARSWGVYIKKSYSTSNISLNASYVTENDKNVGQIIGLEERLGNNKTTVQDVFAQDRGLKPVGQNVTINTSDILKTEQEMKQQSTYKNFDFNVVWKMTNGAYPQFKSASDITTVTGKLSTTEYYIGERLNVYGATLNVDGSTIEMTEDMINLSDFDTSTEGNRTIKGNYKGKEFTLNYTTIKPKYVRGLVIDPNSKGETNYVEGESYTLDGVRLQADVGRGYKIFLTSGFTHNKQQPLKPSDTSVEINYQGHKINLPIHVESKKVIQIEKLKSPDVSSFTTGSTLSLAGGLFRLKYNDGTYSQAFGSGDFSKHGIKIAQNKNGVYNDFDLKTPLTTLDTNTSIYIYLNSLPSQYSSVNVHVFTISVTSTMFLDTQNLYFTIGQDNYPMTEFIEGGSGNYNTTLIEGTLPRWAKIDWVPNDWADTFSFEGSPTKEESVKLVYRVEDVNTKETIDVVINLHAVNIGTEADILSFELEDSNRQKYYGEINGTSINFKVPSSVNTKSMNSHAVLSRGATGTTNFIKADFSNPKSFEITSENKINKKTYTVTVTKESNIPTSINVLPGKTEVTQGDKRVFSTKVNGTGTFGTDVLWYVLGNKSHNTTIAANGELYVAPDETALRVRVIAASKDAPSVLGVGIVDILQAPSLSNPSNLQWNNGTASWLDVPNATQYNVSLFKDNVLVQGSTETVTETKIDYSNQIFETGSYTFKVIANGDQYKPSQEVESSKYDFVAPPNVTGVEVTPSTINLKVGESKKFTASVVGDNITSQDVTWSVDGTTNSGTTITNDGTLKIANNETAKIIKVKASSVLNANIFGESIVTINLNKLQSPSNIKFSSTVGEWDSVTNASSYDLQLKKDGVTLGNKINVTTTNYDFSNLMTDKGSYSFTIVAVGDNVTYSNSDEANSPNVSYTPPSTVTSVEVTPNNVSVEKGKTQQFSANVIGSNNPSQGISWTVSGGNSNTTISNNGLLTIGRDETSSTVLVTATSKQDNKISGKVSVNLTVPKLSQPQNLVFSGTSVSWDNVDYNDGYVIELYKNGQLVQNSNKTLTKDTTQHNYDALMTTTDKYTFKVKAKGNNVTGIDSDFIESNNYDYTAPPTITGVTISPKTATVAVLDTFNFTATVNGTNSPPQDILWSVSDNKDNNTKISNTGVLTVGNNETSKSIKVTATSKNNSQFKDIAVVTIVVKKLAVPSDLQFNKTVATWKNVVNNSGYVIELYKDNVFVTNSRVELNKDTVTYDYKDLMVLSGDYTFKIKAKGDNTSNSDSDFTTSKVNKFVGDPIVQSVEITPKNVTVQKGGTQTFKAVVNGLNNPSQDVDFTVSGNTSQTTTITNNGVLTVALSENSKTITVTATSKTNNNVKESTTVNISLIQLSEPNNITFNGTTANWDNVQNAVSYTTNLYNGGKLVANSTKTVNKNSVDYSSLMKLNGKYTIKVFANGDLLTYSNSGTVESSINNYIAPPIVTDIVITPNFVSVEQGGTYQFNVVVEGFNNPSQNVEWNVIDVISKDTNVSENGLLTIGLDEQLGTIKVSATSKDDPSVTAIINAKVLLKRIESPTNVSWNGTVASWSSVLNAEGYFVYLYKDGELLTTKEVYSTSVDFSYLMSDVGTYQFKVVSKGDKLTSEDSVETSSTVMVISNEDNLPNDNTPPLVNPPVNDGNQLPPNNNDDNNVISNVSDIDENSDTEVIPNTDGNEQTVEENKENNNITAETVTPNVSSADRVVNSNNSDKVEQSQKVKIATTALAGVATVGTLGVLATGSTSTVATAVGGMATGAVNGAVGVIKKLLLLLFK